MTTNESTFNASWTFINVYLSVNKQYYDRVKKSMTKKAILEYGKTINTSISVEFPLADFDNNSFRESSRPQFYVYNNLQTWTWKSFDHFQTIFNFYEPKMVIGES